MAKRLKSLMARSCLLCLAACSLSACVSTERLYAEYDALHCDFVIQQSSAGELSLRERISNTHFPWEPAVYFEFDGDELADQNRHLLTGAVTVLQRYPQLNLSLQGFSDRIGTTRYNRALANRRVAAVRDYLVQSGIERERVVDQPIGEGLPQFGSDDAKSREINRRVELMLLDEEGRPLHPLFDFKGL